MKKLEFSKTQKGQKMQENNEKIAVIIPCYNEEKSVCAVIDEVRGVLPEAEIWVFDNNSTDKSAALVSEKIAQIQSQIQAKSLNLAKNREIHANLSGILESEVNSQSLANSSENCEIHANSQNLANSSENYNFQANSQDLNSSEIHANSNENGEIRADLNSPNSGEIYAKTGGGGANSQIL